MQVVIRTLFSKSERTLLDRNQCYVLETQSDASDNQGGLNQLPGEVEIRESTFAKSLLNGALRKSDQIEFKVESEPETQVLQVQNSEAQT